MRDFTTRASRIQLRVVLLLICVAGAPLGASAQDCPELPALEPLELEKCNFANVACQNRNKERQADWQNQMRRFSTPTEWAKADGTTATQSIEYQIGGCWGSIVNIDVNAQQLTSLRYELLAPSGSTVAGEQLDVRGGMVTGRSIELPESGFYRMRLLAGAAAVSSRVCERRKSLNPLSECVAWKNATTYPYKFTVAFRGNPEAPVLRVGERGEGTVTQAEPRSRRVAVEAGQHARAVVRTTGGQVTCRVQREDRSTVPATAGNGGCEVTFPETDRDALYMVALSSATTAPVGVSILVEEASARAGAPGPAAPTANAPTTRGGLQLGADIEGVFELAGAPGTQDAAQWAVDVPTAGAYALTVVPSGLAGLEVELTMYTVKTEELVVDRIRVANRQVVPVKFAVAGPHVLLIKPLKHDPQRAQGTAKYTLRLERASTPAPARGVVR